MLSTPPPRPPMTGGVAHYHHAPESHFVPPAADAHMDGPSRYPLRHERPGSGAQLPSGPSGAPTRQVTMTAPSPLDNSTDSARGPEGAEAQPPPTPWLAGSGGAEAGSGEAGSGTGQVSSSGAGTDGQSSKAGAGPGAEAAAVFKSGLTRRSVSKQRFTMAPASMEDEVGPLPLEPPDARCSPNVSGSNWVDTVTLWSAVQRTGEEMQRKRRMQEVPGSACVGSAFGFSQWRRQTWRRIKTCAIVTGRVARKDPWTVTIPLVLLVVLLSFGLWGVFSVAYAIRDGRIANARNAAVDYGKKLASHVTATVAPASTMKTLIQLDPEWPAINETFYQVAPGLIKDGFQNSAIITIVLAPQGVVSSIIPDDLPAWKQVYGLDLLQNKSWRGDALKTVQLHGEGGQRDMVMTGPSRLRAGMMGIVTRHAVFVDGGGPNETWGYNGSAYNCTPCWLPGNQTTPSRRFWGFAQLNVDWEILVRNLTRLYDLCERDGLHFNMTYIDPVTFANRSIAECGIPRDHPISIDVDVMHNHWSLAVYDSRGWTPDWLPLVVTVVVLGCLWISITLAIILINRREHMWLLQAMLPKKVISALRRGEDYAEAFESVTVLFSDIVSYTTLASQMEPIKVVRLLNEMYSAFDVLVDEYDCYKVETIGDAFMAVCGTQGEDSVTAAVRVARLAQAMVERTKVLVSQDGQRVQIRIGLHSGPVVGAVVGFKMPHFCLCGDTVNTASRMESNSKPMHIHVSGSTAKLLQESGEGFHLDPRGPVTIKGKGTMWTYWLAPAVAAAGINGTGAGGVGAGCAGADGSRSNHREQQMQVQQQMQAQELHALNGEGYGGAGGAYVGGAGDRLTFGEVSIPQSLMAAGGGDGASDVLSATLGGMGSVAAAPLDAMPSAPMERFSRAAGPAPQLAMSLDGTAGVTLTAASTAAGTACHRALGYGTAFNTGDGVGPAAGGSVGMNGGGGASLTPAGSEAMLPLTFSNNNTGSHGVVSGGGGGGRLDGGMVAADASPYAGYNHNSGVNSAAKSSGRLPTNIAVINASNGSLIDAAAAAGATGRLSVLSRNGGCGGSGQVSERMTPIGAPGSVSAAVSTSGAGNGGTGVPGVFFLPAHAALRVDGDDPPMATDATAAAAATTAAGCASTVGGVPGGGRAGPSPAPGNHGGVMLRVSMPSPGGSSPLVGTYAGLPSTGLPSGGRPSYSSRPHSRPAIHEGAHINGTPGSAYCSAGPGYGAGMSLCAGSPEAAAAAAVVGGATGAVPVGSPQVFQSGLGAASHGYGGYGHGYGVGSGYGTTVSTVSAGQQGLISMGSLDVGHLVASPMVGTPLAHGAASSSGVASGGRRGQRTMSHVVNADVATSMLGGGPSERDRQEKPSSGNLITAMLGGGAGDRKTKRSSVDLRLFQQSSRSRDRGT
ncbi:hypothetical protein HYH02_010037 [Chlamydomonas schloesseri]|uniref:Guanylate cyclase domain-containing protein n=1 Tax=Chlamydomonas schloesseri TaxID=2026947 RepID=A0A835W8A1_9CHLO|nr:hypothetical protein HYH02_010037 [Chlamydomonas schloesseri]|eukprot:KAG2441193.1 hypothetical protein HYH02_010037 [Chlamydomonas schloesseri]